jgi:hypothetical protein
MERIRATGRLPLREEQNLRFDYGLTERQLRELFREARRSKDNTTRALIELLERRLEKGDWTKWCFEPASCRPSPLHASSRLGATFW